MAKTPTYITDATAFIETWLNHLFPLLNQPSISLAVAHEGNIVFQKAWGLANIAKKEAATPNHIYRVASHSKSFTAFLVAKLVDEGTLKLDEPILTYLPWLKPNKTYAAFTLRQILSHSTGNQRDGDDASFWSYGAPFPTADELKAYFLKAKPVIETNTRHKYSNYAFSLAGMVIEAATGKSFQSIMEEKLIKPLGLKNTGTDNPASGKKLCTGYSNPEDGKHYPLNPMLAANGMASATGFHSTPTDLVTTFGAFLLSTQHISRAVQKELMHPVWATTPEKPDLQWYCLGLAKITRNGKAYFQHGGGYPGFITRTSVAPHNGISVSICTNSLNADTPSIINSIYDIIDFFQTKRGTKNPLCKYETTGYNIWGSGYVLAGSGSLNWASLTSRSPLESMGTLAPKAKDTFEVTSSDGYGSVGETVSFTFKNGKPSKILFGSHPSVTDRATYLKQLQNIALK